MYTAILKVTVTIFVILLVMAFHSLPSFCAPKETKIANLQTLPADIETLINAFYERYNAQDYKTIYKDMVTSRFRSSNDFEDFKKAMAGLFEQFGVMQKKNLSYLYHDTHADLRLAFYRTEYKVTYENGETIDRLVVMNDGRGWFIDGFAVATDKGVKFAQGNIYVTEKAVQTKKDSVWDFSKLVWVWKDTKTEYILKSISSQSDELSYHRALQVAMSGDFENAENILKDSFGVNVLAAQMVLHDAKAGKISKEMAMKIFEGQYNFNVKKDIPAAVAAYEEAIKNSPYIPALVFLASVYFSQNDLQKSIAVLEQARSLEPENPKVLTFLIACYSRAGDKENVQKLTETVKQLSAQKSVPKQEVIPEGPYKKYYDNGNLAAEMTIVNGKPEGQFRFYYETGKLAQEGNLKDGRLDGTIKIYDENGKLRQEMECIYGVTVNVRRYDEQGQMVSEGKVLLGEPM